MVHSKNNVIFSLTTALWFSSPCESFILAPSCVGNVHWKWTTTTTTTTTRERKNSQCRHNMVRNIDLPEAIVFYGWDSFADLETGEVLPGVDNLLQECQDVQSAAILIADRDDHDHDDPNGETTPLSGVMDDISTRYTTKYPSVFSIIRYTDQSISTASKSSPSFLLSPPNPRILLETIENTRIQPKGFGGSSGFGRKAPDPERAPLPKHTVVLTTTVDQCRAARFVGARALCLADDDNDLADGVMLDPDSGWDEIQCLEDIATPGSYWLNPPPGSKDDEGNKVDVYQVIEYFEKQGSAGAGAGASSDSSVDGIPDEQMVDEPIMSDDEIDAILADLDSL